MGEGTSAIEPRMLAYALASQGPSVMTGEKRLLKEEAYECRSRRSPIQTLTHTSLHSYSYNVRSEKGAEAKMAHSRHLFHAGEIV